MDNYQEKADEIFNNFFSPEATAKQLGIDNIQDSKEKNALVTNTSKDMKEQKLLRLTSSNAHFDNDITSTNQTLKKCIDDGWRIVQISATAYGAQGVIKDNCYVLLER